MESRWLVALFTAVACLAMPLEHRAELSEDNHLTQSGEVQLDTDRRAFEEYRKLIEFGYPPATVMLHAVSSGMPISDITYLAVLADRDRAGEFYDTAVSLLPALPGWACLAGDGEDRYQRYLDAKDLGPQPTVAQVARLYFDDDSRLAPFPDWQQGRFHINAPVEELANLVDNSRYWYQPGADDGSPQTAPGRVIPIALYRHDRGIVVDRAALPRIENARRQGRATLPVLFVYNDRQQRPISLYGSQVELQAIAERFFDTGVELTSVPEWAVGDHHKMATVPELEAILDLPAKRDIDRRRLDQVARDIEQNGGRLPKPLLLTLLRTGAGRVWVDDPATVVVAKEKQIDSLPVTLFFHELDREACGAPARCEDTLCTAAVAAGADSGVCYDGGARAGSRTEGAAGGAELPPPAAAPPPPAPATSSPS